MGKTLEEIINRHGLNIATDVSHIFKRRDNSEKSTKDLTLTRGLKNVKKKTKEILRNKNRNKKLRQIVKMKP